jgi:hypothetical protein
MDPWGAFETPVKTQSKSTQGGMGPGYEDERKGKREKREKKGGGLGGEEREEEEVVKEKERKRERMTVLFCNFQNPLMKQGDQIGQQKPKPTGRVIN